MCLPSSSTVQRYKSFGHSESGWSDKITQGLTRAMAHLPPKSKYGILSFDEVKVKEGLIYNPHTGDLIGKHNILIDTNPRKTNCMYLYLNSMQLLLDQTEGLGFMVYNC